MSRIRTRAVREGTRGLRTWLHLGKFTTHTEAYIASGARHAGIGIRTDDEHAGLQLFAGIPKLANIWLTVGSPALGRRLPHDLDIIDIRFHDRAVWWAIWHDMWEWSSKTPRWRKGAWHWFEGLAGKPVHTKETVEGPEFVGIPMPEGVYQATATITRHTFRRPRWPWPKQHRSYTVEILSRPGPDGPYLPEPDEDGNCPPGYIPEPGKGENAWDCGPDGLFSLHGPGRTIEQAISETVHMALRNRRRRGAPMDYAEPIT